MSSTGALVLDKVPERLLVVGAGVIGLELGSVWRRLGSRGDRGRVSRPHPARTWTTRSAASSSASSKSRGSRSSCRPRSPAVEASGNKLKATVEPAAGGAAETIDADVVLVSIGRVPFTEGLGLEEAGVKKDNKGRVIVDAHYATNVPGIYAIGDVIAGPMLAHKARGRRRGGGGDPRRPGRARELRRDPERGLHLSGGRLGRQERGGTESRPALPTTPASFPSPPTAAPRSISRPKAS